MNEITILNRYSIFIGEGILGQLSKLINLKQYSNFFLIIDQNLEKAWSKRTEDLVPSTCGKIFIQSGEQSKNIETVQKIWKTMMNSNCDRKSLVINIGGGTIGDIGGFAAATFMRGVDFVQIPTTLLSQVDASVGGKVGINFLGIKNLIGTFQQPIAVIIDVDILATLPQREFISGFAEIIKHGAIADKEYFKLVTSKKPADYSQEELIKIIKRSCQIKTRIILADEREEGPRKLLNFGHTIGHAIESISQETKNPLLHGEAISIGMALEGKISHELGLLSQKEFEVLEKSLVKTGLPTKTPNMQVDKLLEIIKTDKKKEKGVVYWTLLQNIGKAIYNQRVDDSIIGKVI